VCCMYMCFINYISLFLRQVPCLIINILTWMSHTLHSLCCIILVALRPVHLTFGREGEEGKGGEGRMGEGNCAPPANFFPWSLGV